MEIAIKSSPFQREVREWQRIDPSTGALLSGRLEADRWNNKSNKYGKVIDSQNISTPNGMQLQQRKEMEVLQTRTGYGQQLQVIRSSTIQTSSSRTTIPSSLLSPPTSSSSSTPTNIDLQHQRTYNPRLSSTTSTGSTTNDYNIKHNMENTNNHFRNSILTNDRGRSASTEDMSIDYDNHIVNSDDDDDLNNPIEWKRVSKIRRSLQYPKSNYPAARSRPMDLPENLVSVSKIRKDLELGFDRINGSVFSNVKRFSTERSVSPIRPISIVSNANVNIDPTISPTDLDNNCAGGVSDLESKQLIKKTTLITANTLRDIRNKLKKLSDESLYKDDMVGGNTLENQSVITNTAGSTYSYKNLTKNSIPSREYNTNATDADDATKLQLKFRPNREQTSAADWYLRRKSYGFEEMPHQQQETILSRVMESSTDSGIGRSGEISSICTPTLSPLQVLSSTASPTTTTTTIATTQMDRPRGTIISLNGCDSTDEYLNETRPPENSKILINFNGTTIGDNTSTITTTLTNTLGGASGIGSCDGTNTTTTTNSTVAVFSSVIDENSRRSKRVEFCKTEVHFAAESGRVNIVETDGKPPSTNNFRRRRRTSSGGSSNSSSSTTSTISNSATTIQNGEFVETINKPQLKHFGDDEKPKENSITFSEVSSAVVAKTNEENQNDIRITVAGATTAASGQNEILINRSLLSSSGSSSSSITPSNGLKELNDQQDLLDEISLRGILKNKPIKPRPYHLGENFENSELMWGIRLKPITNSSATSGLNEHFDDYDGRINSSKKEAIKQFGDDIDDDDDNDVVGGGSVYSKSINDAALHGFSTKINLNAGDDKYYNPWEEKGLLINQPNSTIATTLNNNLRLLHQKLSSFSTTSNNSNVTIPNNSTSSLSSPSGRAIPSTVAATVTSVPFSSSNTTTMGTSTTGTITTGATSTTGTTMMTSNTTNPNNNNNNNFLPHEDDKNLKSTSLIMRTIIKSANQFDEAMKNLKLLEEPSTIENLCDRNLNSVSKTSSDSSVESDISILNVASLSQSTSSSSMSSMTVNNNHNIVTSSSQTHAGSAKMATSTSIGNQKKLQPTGFIIKFNNNEQNRIENDDFISKPIAAPRIKKIGSATTGVSHQLSQLRRIYEAAELSACDTELVDNEVKLLLLNSAAKNSPSFVKNEEKFKKFNGENSIQTLSSTSGSTSLFNDFESNTELSGSWSRIRAKRNNLKNKQNDDYLSESLRSPQQQNQQQNQQNHPKENTNLMSIVLHSPTEFVDKQFSSTITTSNQSTIDNSERPIAKPRTQTVITSPTPPQTTSSFVIDQRHHQEQQHHHHHQSISSAEPIRKYIPIKSIDAITTKKLQSGTRKLKEHELSYFGLSVTNTNNNFTNLINLQSAAAAPPPPSQITPTSSLSITTIKKSIPMTATTNKLTNHNDNTKYQQKNIDGKLISDKPDLLLNHVPVNNIMDISGSGISSSSAVTTSNATVIATATTSASTATTTKKSHRLKEKLTIINEKSKLISNNMENDDDEQNSPIYENILPLTLFENNDNLSEEQQLSRDEQNLKELNEVTNEINKSVFSEKEKPPRRHRHQKPFATISEEEPSLTSSLLLTTTASTTPFTNHSKSPTPTTTTTTTKSMHSKAIQVSRGYNQTLQKIKPLQRSNVSSASSTESISSTGRTSGSNKLTTNRSRSMSNQRNHSIVHHSQSHSNRHTHNHENHDHHHQHHQKETDHRHHHSNHHGGADSSDDNQCCQRSSSIEKSTNRRRTTPQTIHSTGTVSNNTRTSSSSAVRRSNGHAKTLLSTSTSLRTKRYDDKLSRENSIEELSSSTSSFKRDHSNRIPSRRSSGRDNIVVMSDEGGTNRRSRSNQRHSSTTTTNRAGTLPNDRSSTSRTSTSTSSRLHSGKMDSTSNKDKAKKSSSKSIKVDGAIRINSGKHQTIIMPLPKTLAVPESSVIPVSSSSGNVGNAATASSSSIANSKRFSLSPRHHQHQHQHQHHHHKNHLITQH